MATNESNAIEKLKGSENYHTWKFAMQNMLEFHGLDNCIDSPCTETDAAKLKKAKARIVLSISESLFVHIQTLKTASEIWSALQNLFDDKGLSRQIGLLRKLITIRLENCEDMSEYVNSIIGTGNKLKGIGFDITDEWIGAILLAGLTDNFKPLIMGIESSGIKITGDFIKSKLLETNYSEDTKSAFFGANKSKFKNQNLSHKKQIKCYNCGKKNHLASECRNPKIKNNKSEKTETKPKGAFTAVYFSQKGNKLNEWYLDSGATHHMTSTSESLNNKSESDIHDITVANNSKLKVTGVGDTSLRVNSTEIDVKNVLVVPDLSVNLLSIAKIVEKNNTVIFNKNGCRIYDKDNKLLVNTKSNSGVYKIENKSASCMLATETNDVYKWHRRLGHINFADLQKMGKGIVNGMNIKDGMMNIKCEVCMEGKQARAPFKHSNSKTDGLLDLIHSDLCGPMETTSIGGAKYFLTLIDDHSRKIFIYFLRSKGEILNIFKQFKELVETQTGRKIKIFRTDNGKEYCNNEFDAFCKRFGIIHQKSNPYTPQQNGIAERANRTIIERAKCMLFDAKLDKTYWAEAVNTAVYTINRSISSILINNTPEGVWSGQKTNVEHMRIFGSPIMVYVPKQKRLKLDKKSKKLIFIGYSEETKGYRCIDPITKKVQISRDVVFMEPEPETEKFAALNEDVTPVGESLVESEDQESLVENKNEESSNKSETSDTSMYDDPVDQTFVPDDDEEEEGIASPKKIRRTSRVPKPIILDDFVSYTARADQEEDDPLTIEDAFSRHDSELWKSAINKELNSLKENHTWTMVDLPKNRNPIKCKWVFKKKNKSIQDGQTTEYKARLVAKGCSQKYGIDYTETYSPVVRYTSIRYLIALAVKHNLKIDQMDAITAFLQGNLKEDIYMTQPEGFKDGTTKVCKLNKAIYGLKQSGREWNLKLANMLNSFGLKKSKIDPCIFFNNKLIVAIYVDDLLILWKEKKSRDELKRKLCNTFHMKDLGTARNVIGFNITYEENGISLNQTKYLKEVLAKFGMSNCKSVSTPSDPNQKLSNNMADTNNVVGKVPYQEAVGSLLYLAQGTRPDIAFAVNDVSRFNNNHSEAHWTAVKRICRYLQGTSELKLNFTKSEDQITGYCDADWASDIDKRRSCTGYVFKLSGAAISWASKRQPTVALSTTEAEYMALASSTQEAIWLKQLKEELDFSMKKKSINIKCDNRSAIKLAETDGYRARTKHIDVRHHYVRDRIEDATISIQHIGTEEMIADNLTKAVVADKHRFCTINMGIY